MTQNQLVLTRNTSVIIKSGTGGHYDMDECRMLVADLGELDFVPPIGSTVSFEGFLKEYLPSASAYNGQAFLVRNVHQTIYVSDRVKQLVVEIEVIPA